MCTPRSEIGAKGEEAACAYLIQRGYRILRRNYRQRSGEIDIIAEYGDLIVFVEVKTRRSVTYGSPAEAVGYRKQQKIIGAAMLFLGEHCLHGRSFRFDVLEVLLTGGTVRYNHIINAFGR
ncbi:MAG: YraN family protein [Negativicutes bacterium]|nr:YraN family protein [Negativicutes bacterium]